MSQSFLDDRVQLLCGDCLKLLESIAEQSVDVCCTDPPYHLTSIVRRFGKEGSAAAQFGSDGRFARGAAGFMGKRWDGGDIAFRSQTWAKVLRVLKPGAYLVAFSSTRTFARMSVAIEDAGFITHPFIAWIFGQGFPKAHRVQDDEWEGWYYGTQSLKPAIEPIYVGQKPFEHGLNGTQNILKWRTGALNIDACRIETTDRLGGGGCNADTACAFTNDGWRRPWMDDPGARESHAARLRANTQKSEMRGRWPSNLIHDGSDEVLSAFPDAPGQQRSVGPEHGEKNSINVYGDYGVRPLHTPRQDSGSAARFYYTAKATGVDRLGSNHPTVKPISLMRYLVRLVTPPGGLVLDPFAGTGTTAEAALHEGLRALLIEAEPEYQQDIRRRMELVRASKSERLIEGLKAADKVKSIDKLPLFRSAAA